MRRTCEYTRGLSGENLTPFMFPRRLRRRRRRSKVEVNSGGYLPSRKAARKISTTLHGHCFIIPNQWIASSK